MTLSVDRYTAVGLVWIAVGFSTIAFPVDVRFLSPAVRMLGVLFVFLGGTILYGVFEPEGVPDKKIEMNSLGDVIGGVIVLIGFILLIVSFMMFFYIYFLW